MSVNLNNLKYTASRAATHASRMMQKNTLIWLGTSRQATYYH